MTPAKLNGVARLVLIAYCRGPQFLDDANSFDSVVGRGRFAELDRDALRAARRIVKSGPYGFGDLGGSLAEAAKNTAEDELQG